MFGMLPRHVRDASRFSTKRRKHGVQAMSRAQAHFQAFWVVSGTRCAGHIRDKLRPRQAVLGMYPDFQAFLDSFWDIVCRPCPGRVLARPCPGRSLIFKYFKIVSGSRCAGHVQDTFEPWRGWSLIFRHFKAIFGHSVQAMSGTRPDRGHVRDVSWPRQGRRLIFRHFFAISGSRCAGHLQDTTGTFPEFLVFFGSFWNTVCKQCSGCVWATTGMQPGFQAFLGNFWDTMCRPCLGRFRATPRTQPNFQAFSGMFLGIVCRLGPRRSLIFSFWARYTGHVRDALWPGHVRDASWPGQGRNLIFRQFRAVFGHNVPALSGTSPSQGCRLIFRHVYAIFGTRCAGQVRDVSWPRSCLGRVRDATKFSGISGKFLGTVCKPHPGCVLVAVGTQPDFQAFVGCAGNVRDVVRATAGIQPNFQALVGNFWDMVCKPCPGCGRAAA
ncbi:Hypothetical predicted protein [Olea europaea subsp. europaea]|uniref:Uncharacterized protein n=1 Tax=Olea europaea subsp. europaea TaxID=158383 RepID=A0A8S0SXP2_OLEEU|nr:Hypothetical predicted protein [Olea europaea subsp. europaea]